MTQFSAIGAAGVVMDVHTGEVLAMTSLPTHEPERSRARHAGSDVQPRDARRVRAWLDLQAVHARDGHGLGRRQSDRRRSYNCPEALHAYGHLIHDTHPFGRSCSVAEIMMESSNIGMAQIADQVWAQSGRRLGSRRWVSSTRPTIELRERGRPLTPGARWGPFETMTIGFGQGIAVAPLQLAMGYATLFDGGIYHPPTILKIGPGHPLPPGRRVFTDDTSYRMRSLLRLVVMKGTGKKADAPGYRIGGKTGTAQKLINGHYSQTINLTSFAGVFPMDDPRYVIVVMLDEPKADARRHTASPPPGWNVAPVVSRTRQPDRADARRRAEHEPRAEHVRGAAVRSRPKQDTNKD